MATDLQKYDPTEELNDNVAQQIFERQHDDAIPDKLASLNGGSERRNAAVGHGEKEDEE